MFYGETINDTERAAIVAHLKGCLRAAEAGLKRANRGVAIDPTDMSARNVDYWTHAIGCLKWAMKLAEQRKGTGEHVERPGL